MPVKNQVTILLIRLHNFMTRSTIYVLMPVCLKWNKLAELTALHQKSGTGKGIKWTQPGALMPQHWPMYYA